MNASSQLVLFIPSVLHYLCHIADAVMTTRVDTHAYDAPNINIFILDQTPGFDAPTLSQVVSELFTSLVVVFVYSTFAPGFLLRDHSRWC